MISKLEVATLCAAKYKLEDYLKLKGVKDWWVLDEQTANQVMAISTFKVWSAWRDIHELVEKYK
jgi:hypothetical protein